jgi:hypothetical protein
VALRATIKLLRSDLRDQDKVVARMAKEAKR